MDVMVDKCFFILGICEIRFLFDSVISFFYPRSNRPESNHLGIPKVCSHIIALLAELERDDFMHLLDEHWC